MNIGSLYIVKNYLWFLFSSKEAATAASSGPFAACAAIIDDEVAAETAYWGQEYNCEVTYLEPNNYVVLIEEDGKFKKVLTSDGRIGWTWFDELYNNCFEEVKKES